MIRGYSQCIQCLAGRWYVDDMYVLMNVSEITCSHRPNGISLLFCYYLWSLQDAKSCRTTEININSFSSVRTPQTTHNNWIGCRNRAPSRSVCDTATLRQSGIYIRCAWYYIIYCIVPTIYNYLHAIRYTHTHTHAQVYRWDITEYRVVGIRVWVCARVCLYRSKGCYTRGVQSYGLRVFWPHAFAVVRE